MPLTREELDRFLSNGFLVLSLGPGVKGVKNRYLFCRSRADGMLVPGTTFFAADPSLMPVGVQRLQGPPEALKAFRPMIESGSIYFVAFGSAVYLYELSGCWEVWKDFRFGAPSSPPKVFPSAVEAVEFVFSLLSQAESTA